MTYSLVSIAGSLISRHLSLPTQCLFRWPFPPCDEVAPKIEYWTEWTFNQQLIKKLVEHLSDLAWTAYRYPTSFVQILKEFRDSSHRSVQAESFINKFSARHFWLFAATSAEDLAMAWQKGMGVWGLIISVSHAE